MVFLKHYGWVLKLPERCFQVFSLHGETTNTHITRRFSGLHGENSSERSLPGSDNLCCFNLAPKFRRNMLSPTSGVQLIPVSWSMVTKAACSPETSALTYSTILCVNSVKFFDLLHICVLSTSSVSVSISLPNMNEKCRTIAIVVVTDMTMIFE